MRVVALALGFAVLATAGLTPRSASDSTPSDAVLRATAATEAGSAQTAEPVVRIGLLRGSSHEIVSLPLEEYVSRVLAGEALPGSPPAALEALAIAIRTYTKANLGRHGADGFDLCDQTHCQVMRPVNAATDRAAQATGGTILLFHGTPATIYYSASCGGHTELPSAVWPGADDPPYLPSRSDDGCGGDPVWTSELALTDLQRSFAAAGFRGRLRSMAIAARDSSGRVAKLTLDGLTPSEISGQDLRAAVGRTLGWQHVRSAAFELRRSGDVYRMDGRGSGHGVGMCVIGSAKLAAAGESSAAILQRYYPGVEFGGFTSPAATRAAPLPAPVPALPSPPIPAPATSSARPTLPSPAPARIPDGIDVSLAEGDEGERDAIQTLAVQERDTLAAALGVAAPERVSLRFHPTTDDYARVTGKAWFTSGAVVNGEIHLPPLPALRDRDALDRALRRQLVHLMIDDDLGRRPAWVRDGAALYFADGATPGAVSRASCPSDSALLKPVSPGALGTALADAKACFARQIAAGRSWREVR